MEKIFINVKEDFSEFPGGRKSVTFENSGEDFFNKLLRPKFIEAEGKILEINLDGTAGLAPSFIDEAFGRLAHEFGLEVCQFRLEIITEEEPFLEEDINTSMKEWDERGVHDNSDA